jgi:hypothetical protein
MIERQKWSIFGLSLCLSLCCHQVKALPGQSSSDVATWIASHSTLAPASSANGLFVKKSNTAAQTFTFEANRGRGLIISSERLSFFDMINGVTNTRLEESLRTIYGADIYQDYQNAQVVYSYPTAETLDLARRQNLPLLAAQQGQLRLGERFAYWIETTQTDTGIAYNGFLEVLLKDDLSSLQRSITR